MSKNVSSSDDMMANLGLPLTQFRDIRNIIKNKSFASKFDKITQISVGSIKILKINEKGKEDSGFLKFKYKSKDLVFYYDSKKRLAETLGMIKDEFISEESGKINVRNKEVIDVGAYVADTSIYYAANGAKHVYAFEPYPYFYNLGVKNVKANRLEKKITMINAGCGSDDGKIGLESSSQSFTNINPSTKKTRSDKSVPIISLEKFVRSHKLNNLVLKIDCEGCEYGILFGTDVNILRKFSEIQIEYHYGYKNLEQRLKEVGFNVKKTKPVKKYNFTTKSFMVLGFINAKRL